MLHSRDGVLWVMCCVGVAPNITFCILAKKFHPGFITSPFRWLAAAGSAVADPGLPDVPFSSGTGPLVALLSPWAGTVGGDSGFGGGGLVLLTTGLHTLSSSCEHTKQLSIINL